VAPTDRLFTQSSLSGRVGEDYMRKIGFSISLDPA
jgi:hypothetical protein